MDLKDITFSTADRLLKSGIQPTPLLVSETIQCETADVEPFMSEWWSQVPQRLLASGSLSIPQIPEVLHEAFTNIWEQAVHEAQSKVVIEHEPRVDYEYASIEADQSLKEVRARQLELEEKLRNQVVDNEEVRLQVKGYEAEIDVLKTNLAAETSQRKQEEQSRLNVEQELNHLRKTFDDSKKTFDQRIKEEQRHTLEAVSKAEADIRYYRGSLEKLRDEVGKKESALTKNIHDLQSESARKEVKNDTYRTQIKSLEDELKKVKAGNSSQNRDLSKINTSLLSEVNKNKRLEDKVKDLEEELLKARKKQATIISEQSRREAGIRQQYKDKEEELVRALSKIAVIEKKVITQDEEIRRLNNRL
ncbi:DNA-binding protein [uncultured Neptuniibacter sp.]|uniref:DNA-binding protein n=1 Tax=uncultured Neptuniibacter sp. TaxID=502143 RepID=UPI002639D446|nr:DNA-binding protein [uncultured Neptuniibacter sp.]